MSSFITGFSIITMIEPILRAITYIAAIIVLFKLLKAINIYIDKNSK